MSTKTRISGDMKPERITFDVLAKRYCERQMQSPEGLLVVLQRQAQMFRPDGWALLECAMLDSSHLGEYTILPYGPKNTFTEVPSRPVSPRGLASDMSVAVAFMPVEELPSEVDVEVEIEP